MEAGGLPGKAGALVGLGPEVGVGAGAGAGRGVDSEVEPGDLVGLATDPMVTLGGPFDEGVQDPIPCNQKHKVSREGSGKCFWFWDFHKLS